MGKPPFKKHCKWRPLNMRMLLFYNLSFTSTGVLAACGKDKPRKMLDTWAKQHDLTSSEPFQRFLNTAVFHKDMASFLQNLLLGQESDLMRSATGKLYEAGAVTLMTLHGSKGLIFF